MAVSGFPMGLDLRLSSLVFLGFLEILDHFLVFLQLLSAILKRLGVVGKQPLPFACVHGLLHVVQDARLEHSPVLQLDFLGMQFLGIPVECVLYLIDDRYIGNGGALCIHSPLALLILEPLKYPVSLKNFHEVTGKSGVSKEQFLEKTFHWGLHESFLGR